MKKVVLFIAMTLFVFFSTVAYAAVNCEQDIDAVQALYSKLNGCIAHCGGWTKGACVDGCQIAYQTMLRTVGAGCFIQCSAEGKATEFCWREKPASMATISAKEEFYKKVQKMVQEQAQQEKNKNK